MDFFLFSPKTQSLSLNLSSKVSYTGKEGSSIRQRGQIKKISKVHPVHLKGATVPLFLELYWLHSYVWSTFCVPGNLGIWR